MDIIAAVQLRSHSSLSPNICFPSLLDNSFHFAKCKMTPPTPSFRKGVKAVTQQENPSLHLPQPPRTGACQESGGCTTQQVFSAVPGGQGLEQQTLISLRPPVKREAGFQFRSHNLQNVALDSQMLQKYVSFYVSEMSKQSSFLQTLSSLVALQGQEYVLLKHSGVTNFPINSLTMERAAVVFHFQSPVQQSFSKGLILPQTSGRHMAGVDRGCSE